MTSILCVIYFWSSALLKQIHFFISVSDQENQKKCNVFLFNIISQGPLKLSCAKKRLIKIWIQTFAKFVRLLEKLLLTLFAWMRFSFRVSLQRDIFCDTFLTDAILLLLLLLLLLMLLLAPRLSTILNIVDKSKNISNGLHILAKRQSHQINLVLQRLNQSYI